MSGAGVAKLADAQDLKSWDLKGSCGFDSHPRHSPSLATRASAKQAKRDGSIPRRFAIEVALVTRGRDRRGGLAQHRGRSRDAVIRQSVVRAVCRLSYMTSRDTSRY